MTIFSFEKYLNFTMFMKNVPFDRFRLITFWVDFNLIAFVSFYNNY